MKIKIRKLVDGDIILEEVEATEVQGMKDCAIVHIEKRWIVYDVPTGLLIVYGLTRKQCLENLLDKRHLVIKARDTELYQRRIKEFEELQKL